MSELVLGPLLRYVSDTEATVFVETSEACEVEILGRREPTFRVEGHHYALVRLEDLEPGSGYEYEVALDGKARWPEPSSGLPPSVLRTVGGEGPLDICFGSCRVAAPPRAALHRDAGRRRGRASRSTPSGCSPSRWPTAIARAGPTSSSCSATRSTSTRARRGRGSEIRARRGTATPPGEEVTDFEEYTWLYAGELARAADPLAVLQRLGLDALGRPRHERRLEHLALLAAGDAAALVVAPAGGRLHRQLLDLPAPRQPLAARARRERPLRAGSRQPARRRGAVRVGAARSTRRGRAPAGASAATSAAPGRSSSTPGRAGCSRRTGARSSTRRSGTGSSRRPKATSTTC